MTLLAEHAFSLTDAIEALVAKLGANVLGKGLPNVDCLCDTKHKASEDVAVEIEPPSADCSVSDWVAWSVVMRVPGTPETHITRRVKLSHWIPKQTLRQLFAELFEQSEPQET